ncbi:MAG: hypothetical protein R2728_02710 [Chitinophagales bacterium]
MEWQADLLVYSDLANFTAAGADETSILRYNHYGLYDYFTGINVVTVEVHQVKYWK